MFGLALPAVGAATKALWTRVWPFVHRALLAALLVALGYTWGAANEREKGLKALHAEQRGQLERWGQALELVRKIESGLNAMEKAHEQRVAQLLAEWRTEREEDRARNERRYADLRAGTLRLRVPVVPASVSCPASNSEGQSASGGLDGSATAELDGQAAARIVAITDDGDSAIKQLTALQKYTADLYATCNQEPTQ